MGAELAMDTGARHADEDAEIGGGPTGVRAFAIGTGLVFRELLHVAKNGLV